MKLAVLALAWVVVFGVNVVGALGCANGGNLDPVECLHAKARAAFGVPWDSRRFERTLEKRFGLGSRKVDVIQALTAIAASRDDCEVILTPEQVIRDLHYVSFVIHFESPSDEIVWRFTVDFGFDAQEKLARVLGGSVMSIPRAEAPPWHPGKRP